MMEGRLVGGMWSLRQRGVFRSHGLLLNPHAMNLQPILQRSMWYHDSIHQFLLL